MIDLTKWDFEDCGVEYISSDGNLCVAIPELEDYDTEDDYDYVNYKKQEDEEPLPF